MVRFFWGIAFLALATSVFAGERLIALVTAAQDFSVAIQRQLGQFRVIYHQPNSPKEWFYMRKQKRLTSMRCGGSIRNDGYGNDPATATL
jgi:hypothetical protein